MARILVTGGAGFIASDLALRLASDPQNEVVVVDDLLTGDLAKLRPMTENMRFIKCDVNRFEDISGVFYAHRFQYVFHYAAVVGVKRTIENPVMVLRDIDGIRNILDLSKNTGVQRVIYASSSEVYGEPVEVPQNEQTTPLNSKLPYAIVKNIGEAFLRSYQREFGLDYTIFRFFNTYGPKQSADFVISKFIRAAMAGDDITIYGDGSQTRSFCYVADMVDGLIRLMESDVRDMQPVNLGNPEEVTINELCEVLGGMIEGPMQVEMRPLPVDDPRRRRPDITRAKSLLGWQPTTPLRRGLERTIDWFRLELRSNQIYEETGPALRVAAE